MFTHLVQIKPIHVRLPNGNVIETDSAGTVLFSDKFYLTDVLFIPSFFTNLIYVPKLTKNLHCNIIFNFTNVSYTKSIP